MNDLDRIIRNQATIMYALATICDHLGKHKKDVADLRHAAGEAIDYAERNLPTFTPKDYQ